MFPSLPAASKSTRTARRGRGTLPGMTNAPRPAARPPRIVGYGGRLVGRFVTRRIPQYDGVRVEFASGYAWELDGRMIDPWSARELRSAELAGQPYELDTR